MRKPITLSRKQMIEEIHRHNPSASPRFLRHFNDRSLAGYLDRLTLLHHHRGPNTAWVRSTCARAGTARAA